ncbi:hypothetical protein GDO86_017612, partial [Hymenochirus boettgeri]
MILEAIGIVNPLQGLFLNVFIMSVNFQYWMRGDILNPIDQIIVALSFSGIFYSLAKCAKNTIALCPILTLSVRYDYYILEFSITYGFFSSCWLSACLCWFFFMKMNNFKAGGLLWMKMKIDALVLRLILALELFSILNSLLYSFTSEIKTIVNVTASAKANQTSDYKLGNVFNTGLLIFNCIIPILISTVTTGHIIVSLYKHTQRMKKNMGDGGGPSLEVHKKAACTLTSIIIFNSIVFAMMMGMTLPTANIFNWISYTLFSSYAFVLSIILILGNSRLLQ